MEKYKSDNDLSLTYKGLQFTVTFSAQRELDHLNMSLEDVMCILEEGYEAPRRRGRNIVERWLDRGSKTINVVISKSFDEHVQKEKWIVIRLGKFTRRK